jgi:hypothetical protein
VEGVNVPVVPLKNVPPAKRVPDPENMIRDATPEDVILPVTVTVPVKRAIVEVRAVPIVADRATDPADKVPAAASRVLVPPLPGRDIVTAPVTVSELLPLMVTAVAAEFVPKAIEAQVAAISTVTEMPLLIVTASADVGTAAPPQVAVLLQLPLTLAVRAAACNDTEPMTSVKRSSVVSKTT